MQNGYLPAAVIPITAVTAVVPITAVEAVVPIAAVAVVTQAIHPVQAAAPAMAQTAWKPAANRMICPTILLILQAFHQLQPPAIQTVICRKVYRGQVKEIQVLSGGYCRGYHW